MLEDRLLIWKFNNGSKDAVSRIYEKYESDLLTLAVNLLGDKYTAEDVVQDVFIRFVQLGQFQLRGSLKGYLVTCVINRCRDYLRKKTRDQQTIETHQIDIDEPAQSAIANEQLQKLGLAISSLSYEQREVISLHLNAGLKFRQIAKLQEVSAKTAQSRYRYGLNKLRSILNGEVEK